MLVFFLNLNIVALLPVFVFFYFFRLFVNFLFLNSSFNLQPDDLLFLLALFSFIWSNVSNLDGLNLALFFLVQLTNLFL